MTDQEQSGNFKPGELADLSKHQQYQIFESENRPPPLRPGTAGSAEAGDPSDSPAEGIVGHVAAKDPSGVVVPPAEASRPGASTEIGGTPSALTTSQGRQLDDR
jgi:hypothetical protein